MAIFFHSTIYEIIDADWSIDIAIGVVNWASRSKVPIKQFKDIQRINREGGQVSAHK